MQVTTPQNYRDGIQRYVLDRIQSGTSASYAAMVQRAWRAKMARQFLNALRQENRCKKELALMRHGIEVEECQVCARQDRKTKDTSKVNERRMCRTSWIDTEKMLFNNEPKFRVEDAGDNWLALFQHASSLPTSTQAERLYKQKMEAIVYRDFMNTATLYGRTIISEFFLHSYQRSIRPREIGGLSGGKKYVWRGILFKLSQGSSGPWAGSDEAAAKALGHEMCGVNHYNAVAPEGLNLVPSCLIDFKGFRLIAQAELPISEKTMRAGSKDGGRSVLSADDPELKELLSETARNLNIKEHPCMGVTVYSGADVEAHRMPDGKLYLVDLARSMPPEDPQVVEHFHGVLDIGASVWVRTMENSANGAATHTRIDSWMTPELNMTKGLVVKAHPSLCEYDIVHPDGTRENRVPAYRLRDRRLSVFWRLLRPEFVRERGQRLAQKIDNTRDERFKLPAVMNPIKEVLDKMHNDALEEQERRSPSPTTVTANKYKSTLSPIRSPTLMRSSRQSPLMNESAETDHDSDGEEEDSYSAYNGYTQFATSVPDKDKRPAIMSTSSDSNSKNSNINGENNTLTGDQLRKGILKKSSPLAAQNHNQYNNVSPNGGSATPSTPVTTPVVIPGIGEFGDAYDSYVTEAYDFFVADEGEATGTTTDMYDSFMLEEADDDSLLDKDPANGVSVRKPLSRGNSAYNPTGWSQILPRELSRGGVVDDDPYAPLSADAFTAFSRGDQEGWLRNREVTSATRLLLREVIPSMSQYLCSLSIHELQKLDLSTECHRYGVNMRHLGLVRACIPETSSPDDNHSSRSQQICTAVRELLLAEMVVRTLKHVLREFQRRWMRSEQSTSDMGLRMVVAKFINLVTGNHSNTLHFWKGEVTVGCLQRFGCVCITPAEQADLYTACHSPHILKPMVERIIRVTGLRLSKTAMDQLGTSDPSRLHLLPDDIEALEPVVKRMHCALRSRGELHLSEAQNQVASAGMKGHSCSTSSARLLLLAHAELKEAIAMVPTDARTADVFAITSRLLAAGHSRSEAPSLTVSSKAERKRRAKKKERRKERDSFVLDQSSVT